MRFVLKRRSLQRAGAGSTRRDVMRRKSGAGRQNMIAATPGGDLNNA